MNPGLPRSYALFGTKITPSTLDELLSTVHGHVTAGVPLIVASQNVHGLYVRLREPAVDALHADERTIVHVDGMPIVLLCRLSGIAAERRHRVTLVDLVWPLLTLAEREGWRVYSLGGSDDVVRAARAAIVRRLPRLHLRARHGFFDEADGEHDAGVVAEIRAFRPHLLLVGMGMGRQERWIARHRAELEPACVCTVGACMEYVAGAVRTPPRWMGRTGLEWLFRLVERPRRFWRRYLVEPWVVLAFVLRAALGRKHAHASGRDRA